MLLLMPTVDNELVLVKDAGWVMSWNVLDEVEEGPEYVDEELLVLSMLEDELELEDRELCEVTGLIGGWRREDKEEVDDDVLFSGTMILLDDDVHTLGICIWLGNTSNPDLSFSYMAARL